MFDMGLGPVQHGLGFQELQPPALQQRSCPCPREARGQVNPQTIGPVSIAPKRQRTEACTDTESSRLSLTFTRR